MNIKFFSLNILKFYHILKGVEISHFIHPEYGAHYNPAISASVTINEYKVCIIFSQPIYSVGVESHLSLI